MKRREFLALLAVGAWPVATHAQPAKKVYRVALVGGNGPQSTMRELSITQAFIEGMRELGYSEGENIEYEFHSADGKIADRSGPIVQELVARGVDVIVVAAALLAKEMIRHTTTVPIVMAAGQDLVAMGVVSSLSRPGGNVTGFSNQTGPEIDAKRLQFLKEVAPRVSTVIYLGAKSDWETHEEALRSAAQRLGITISYIEHSLAGHAEAFRAVEYARPDALLVSAFTSLWVKRQAIIEFAHGRRISVMYPWREYVLAGGLISYGVDLVDQWRRTASYVDKILRGADPAVLPIQLPTNFELVINLQTAKAIGIEIPAPILAQAAHVIE